MDGIFVAPIETLSGFFKYFADNRTISSGKVAENIKVCFFAGKCFNILSI